MNILSSADRIRQSESTRTYYSRVGAGQSHLGRGGALWLYLLALLCLAQAVCAMFWWAPAPPGAGEVNALARSEAVQRLGEHPQRWQDASSPLPPTSGAGETATGAAAARIAEQGAAGHRKEALTRGK